MIFAAKPYKSIQVFKSPFLERFSHIHPLSPLLVWAPIVTYLLWQSYASKQLSFFVILSLGMAGIFTWTLVEYLLHRFLFHFEGDSPASERAHFVLHGFHHVDANDPTRLVMPPFVSLSVAGLFYCLFSSLMGTVMAQPFFAFFIVGYLCYDYIHFYVHFFTPKTAVGKYLKQSHMKHHYVGAQSRWGVSSPLWDYVFDTLEESEPVWASERTASKH